MKNSTLSKALIFGSICITVCFAVVPIYSQERNLEREILIYISQDSLNFPNSSEEKNPASLDITSKQLKNTLEKLDLKSIAKAFPDALDSDTIKVREDGVKVGIPQISRIFRFIFNDKADIDSAISLLSKEPSVIFAEKHSNMQIQTDDYYSNQWHLNNTGQTGGTSDADIDAPEAWSIYTGSSSVKIGVIDTGVETSHDDLNGKSSGDTPESYPYDGHSHGTHVAGIAAAIHGNVGKVKGVDANALIISKKIFSGYYCVYAGDDVAYNKIVSAVNSGANILNNSYGGSSYSTTLRIALAYAYKMNTAAVASMGNDSTDTPYYPAAFGQGMIAVGATNYNDIKANYSNYGNHIDVSAPGGDGYLGEQRSIQSTWRGNSYEKISGTSMATAQVSGIASLLKGYNSNLYNDDIEHIIQISVDDANVTQYPGWNQYLGYGRVNAKKALDYLRSPYTINHLSASGGSSYSSTGTYSTALFGVEGLSDGIYTVKRYEIRKSVNFGQVFQSSPYVWGRGVATNGFSNESPNFGMGWCDKVSSTNSSATLKTYIYKVWTISGTYLGYFPTTASNVTWAYTVLGVPVPLSITISGPTYLSNGETGTFTANPSGGSGTYSNYQWWYRYDGEIEPLEKSVPGAKLPPVGTWYYLEDREGDQSITFGPSYNFSLKCTVTDSKGSTATDIHTVIVDELTLDLSIPKQLTVSDNYPNPFNLVTTIKYGLPESGLATVTIYSITGQKIKTLAKDRLPAGYHQIQWDGTNNFGSVIASGLYILELKSGSDRIMKKLILAK